MIRTSNALRIAAIVAVAMLGAAACSGGDTSSDTTAGSGSNTDSGAAEGSGNTTAADDAPDLGRVVALGEEFLLADVLALGVKPVASTATVAEAGFQGMDDFDTDGIEALPGHEPNLERLAALRPDTILAPEHVLDVISKDKLEEIATVIEVPTGTDENNLVELGAALGREARANELVAELNAARDGAADTAPEGCEVSLATIYMGPTPAAWVGAPNNVAVALTDIGCDLAPSTNDVTADGAGRIYLSLEQLGQLSAPKLILLQSEAVEGETASLEELEADPLWQQLPAVGSGNVTTLDRLGYPGAVGLIRLYQELGETVA